MVTCRNLYLYLGFKPKPLLFTYIKLNMQSDKKLIKGGSLCLTEKNLCGF